EDAAEPEEEEVDEDRDGPDEGRPGEDRREREDESCGPDGVGERREHDRERDPPRRREVRGVALERDALEPEQERRHRREEGAEARDGERLAEEVVEASDG